MKNTLLALGDAINAQDIVVIKAEGKLNQLNDPQVKKMEEVKTFWLEYIFSCGNSLDTEKAKGSIEWMYKLSGLDTPIIIFLDSPLACQLAVPLAKEFFKRIKGAQVWAQVGDQVGDQVRAHVRAQVRDQVGAQVWAQVGDQVGDQVWDQVGAQVRDQVGDQVWDQVGAQVRDQVRDQVGDQVWAQVGDQVGDQVRDQVWAQVGDQVGDQVGAQVWDQVGAQVRDQVGDQVWAQVGAQVGDQVRDQVRDQVGDQVRDQVGAQVWDQVWDQVGAQVRDQVGDQVWDQVRDQVNFKYFSCYGNVSDYGWISFFDFFTQLGVVDHEGFKGMKFLLLSGIYDMIQLNGLCVVSSLPSKITRNSNNQLHCEDGPAIEFKDGYKQFYWNGVSVPEEWITHPLNITRETIIREKNAEKRRCIREIIGTEKFAKLLDIIEIDKDHLNNQDVILFKTRKRDDVIGDHIYFVSVTCHSTLRKYFLCVPKEAATNAWGAVAWTFKMKNEEYAPLIET